MMTLNLIRQESNGSFLNCLNEIENSFKSTDAVNLNIEYVKSTKSKNIFLRLATAFPGRDLLKRLFFKNKKAVNFSVLMGASFDSLIPHFLYSTENYIYMYDAWPRFHQMIDSYAGYLNVKVIFFSSHKVTTLFNAVSNRVKGIWIPEAIDIKDYHFVEYQQKNIDVLEFGRKYDLYHNQIVNELAQHKKHHLFERKAGEIIFKTESNFFNGLAHAKISICIPSNITHPDRAEDISSMTLRYLQSMASKCLIVGVMPEEMSMIFDYMPIIEIDFEDPAKQIMDILNHYDNYIALIEKNYDEIKNKHLWSDRIKKILNVIENESTN